MSESIQARLRRFGIWSAIPLLIAGCADPYPYSDNYYAPRNRVSSGVVVQSGGYYREPHWGRNDHRPRPGGWNRPDRGDNDGGPGKNPGKNPGHNSGPKPGAGGSGNQGGHRPSNVWVPPQNNKATGERKGASWINKPAQNNASSEERRGASWLRDNRRVLPEDQ